LNIHLVSKSTTILFIVWFTTHPVVLATASSATCCIQFAVTADWLYSLSRIRIYCTRVHWTLLFKWHKITRYSIQIPT
jgi:hypothetical protein